MRVLHVTNCFPYERDPDYGIFVKRQIDSLQKKVDSQKIIFLNARERGVRAYFDVTAADVIACDVIHCHHVFSFFSVYVYALWYRKPVVLSLLNEFRNEIKVRFPKFALAEMCKLAGRLSNACIYKSKMPSSRSIPNLEYLPNGVDMEYFSPEKSAALRAGSECAYKILFVSSKNLYRKQKRLDLFQQVVDRLANFYSLDIEAVVASGLGADEYRQLLLSCDLHLLCSEYEGSPNSVKEAMSSNLPVVSTDVGNVRLMFGESLYYRVSPSASLEDIAKTCFDVLQMGKGGCDGRARLIQLGLDLNSVADKLVCLYERVKMA